MSTERLTIPGLTEGEQGDVNELWKQLCAKRPRNVLRASYYDGKNAMRHLTTTLPPSFAKVATVLGWPAKAVDALSTRCKVESFVIPGGDIDSLGMRELWLGNRLDAELSQAHDSAFIQSCAFLITTRGDEAAGEPPALITVKDAFSGTGRWNPRRRGIDRFLSIHDVDDRGYPTHLTLYAWPKGTVTADRREGGSWSIDRRPDADATVEPLVYRPRVGRPFGSSRVSRAVMAMTDLAMRTVFRSEVTAELYSVPQQVILGADQELFAGVPDWRIAFGRAFGIPYDDDNDQQPQLKQLQQATQQPHMEQLRALAQLFAGETSIPISSLGITTDANPASAEGYYASREDLIALAEASQDDFKPAEVRTVAAALRIMNPPSAALDAELVKVQAQYRNAAYTSRSTAADAVSKMVAVHPWMADSDAVIDLYGLDPLMKERLLADKRKAAAASRFAMLRQAASEPASRLGRLQADVPVTADDAVAR